MWPLPKCLDMSSFTFPLVSLLFITNILHKPSPILVTAQDTEWLLGTLVVPDGKDYCCVIYAYNIGHCANAITACLFSPHPAVKSLDSDGTSDGQQVCDLWQTDKAKAKNTGSFNFYLWDSKNDVCGLADINFDTRYVNATDGPMPWDFPQTKPYNSQWTGAKGNEEPVLVDCTLPNLNNGTFCA